MPRSGPRSRTRRCARPSRHWVRTPTRARRSSFSSSRAARRRSGRRSSSCPARRSIEAGMTTLWKSAGIDDVLVTNEVIGATKLRHLAALARRARIGVLVDHPQQVQALAAAAKAHEVVLDVYVEVNVGANRCGVAPGEAAVRLAQQIVA